MGEARVSKKDFLEQYGRLTYMWPKLMEGSEEREGVIRDEFYNVSASYSADVVRSAVTEILQTETYTPKPASLAAACKRAAGTRKRYTGGPTQEERIISQVLQTEGTYKGQYKVTAESCYGQRIYWFAKERFGQGV